LGLNGELRNGETDDLLIICENCKYNGRTMKERLMNEGYICKTELNSLKGPRVFRGPSRQSIKNNLLFGFGRSNGGAATVCFC